LLSALISKFFKKSSNIYLIASVQSETK